jgi:chromosome segregation ATPase
MDSIKIANQYYSKILNMLAPYEFEFNASINLAKAYDLHKTRIEQIEKELIEIEGKYEELTPDASKSVDDLSIEYNNLANDRKTLQRKIDETRKFVEDSKERLSTVETLINKLKALIKGLFTTLSNFNGDDPNELTTINRNLANLEAEV